MSAVGVQSGAHLPTRSQIESWDIAHLGAAATRWRALADESEQLFGEHVLNLRAPGGTVWTGGAAESASERVTADMVVVRRQGDILRRGADNAASGAIDLRGAQRKVLDAIADAESDGFKVGEDLSVRDSRRIDPFTAAARPRAAVEHAEYIRWHAEQLVQVDAHIARQVTANAAELEGVRLENVGDSDSNNFVHTFDFQTRPRSPIHEPVLPDDPGGTGRAPTAADIRGVLDRLPEGSKPWIKEVRSPQDLQNLWKWLAENGVEDPSRYGDPTKGVWRDLPDGTGIGQRNAAGSTGKPALDINLPNQGNFKVHINPERGGVPEIPTAVRPGPSESTTKAGPGESSSRGTAPVEGPASRGGLPGGLPAGGAIPDGSMPYLVEPPGPEVGDEELPVIGDGEPD